MGIPHIAILFVYLRWHDVGDILISQGLENGGFPGIVQA